MQGNEIIDKFPAIDFSTDEGWLGRCLPCFVTAEPGTYQLVPLWQKEGETTWVKAVAWQNQNTTEADFEYTVVPPAPDNLPALRDMYMTDYQESNQTILIDPIPFNSDFDITYTISNKGEKALKGQIKAVWEREFKHGSNSYRPGTKDPFATNESEWKEQISDIIDVNIPAGVRFWKDKITCRITNWREVPKNQYGQIYCNVIAHLYWKAEGSDTWELMRLDSDMLMDKEMLQDGWGLNSDWEKTINYVYILLQEWI